MFVRVLKTGGRAGGLSISTGNLKYSKIEKLKLLNWIINEMKENGLTTIYVALSLHQR